MSRICFMLRLCAAVPLIAAVSMPGCGRGAPAAQGTPDHGHEGSPSGEVVLSTPETVRKNLGMTFAAVEARPVARTARFPGRFELPPSAVRDYHAPLTGSVEMLVETYRDVDAGDPLFRINSVEWVTLREGISAAQSLVDSMGPLQSAHDAHADILRSQVSLWEERQAQLEALRQAGGGSAAQEAEARAALIASRAELADVMERKAQLSADQARAGAELKSLRARMAFLVGLAGASNRDEEPDSLTVFAQQAGTVERIFTTPGALVTEHDPVLTVVRPQEVVFRARTLSAEIAQLGSSEGSARVVGAGKDMVGAELEGAYRVAPRGDAEARMIDLLLRPSTAAAWAVPGTAGFLECVVAGGDVVPAVPVEAVVRDGLDRFVFVRDGTERVRRVAVRLGVSDGRWVEVDRLLPGESVVVNGVHQLMLATGSGGQGGHFHADGTFHEGED